MSTSIPPKDLVRLLVSLQNKDEAQRQSVSGEELEPGMALLRAWQSDRLQHTYADLLADRRYRLACEFFLSDIYAARDFSQRNRDAESLHAILSRYLPEFTLRLLANTIRLNRLTEQLDQRLLQTLANDLEMSDSLSAEMYAEAYRRCNNYRERRTQIDLLVRTLYEAATGARNPIFGVSMRLARKPALKAGWEEVYYFLERGARACRPMRSVAYFVNTIQEREMKTLNQIYSGEPNPFNL